MLLDWWTLWLRVGSFIFPALGVEKIEARSRSQINVALFIGAHVIMQGYDSALGTRDEAWVPVRACCLLFGQLPILAPIGINTPSALAFYQRLPFDTETTRQVSLCCL